MYAATATPFGRPAAFAAAYRQIGVETGVSGATPHQLVALLFDGYMDALVLARGALRQKDIDAKGRAIGRAVRILEEGLKSALDLQAGGKLAADLRDLYAYVIVRLTTANLRNDDAALAECQRLIEPVRQAWSEIGARVHAGVR
jgi:flagellar protein FliS